MALVSRVYRGDIETIAGKALEKDKTRRYASAADLAADIRRYLGDEPIQARPASVSYQLQKFARRNKGLVAGVTAVFLALAIGTTVSTWQAIRARQARRVADSRTREAQRELNFLIETFGLADPDNRIKTSDIHGRDLTVVQALDLSRQKLDAGFFADSPLTDAAIRMSIRRTMVSLGQFREAESVLRTALRLREAHLSAEAPDVLRARLALAECLEGLTKWAEAESQVRSVLSISSAALPEDVHVEALAAMGGVFFKSRRYEDAERIRREALQLVRTRSVAEPSGLRQALADTLYAQGKIEEAAVIYRQLLASQVTQLGEEHPATVGTLIWLAGATRQLGRPVAAEEYAKRAVASSRKLYGDTVRTPEALFAQARATYEQGRLEEAEKLWQEALAIDDTNGSDRYRQIVPFLGEVLRMEGVSRRPSSSRVNGWIGHPVRDNSYRD